MLDQPTLVFLWQMAASAGAALLAMALAFAAIVAAVEVYDGAIGAPRPPAFWRRPWCWAFGHDDAGRAHRAEPLRLTCRRCGHPGGDAR